MAIWRSWSVAILPEILVLEVSWTLVLLWLYHFLLYFDSESFYPDMKSQNGDLRIKHDNNCKVAKLVTSVSCLFALYINLCNALRLTLLDHAL